MRGIIDIPPPTPHAPLTPPPSLSPEVSSCDSSGSSYKKEENNKHIRLKPKQTASYHYSRANGKLLDSHAIQSEGP